MSVRLVDRLADGRAPLGSRGLFGPPSRFPVPSLDQISAASLVSYFDHPHQNNFSTWTKTYSWWILLNAHQVRLRQAPSSSNAIRPLHGPSQANLPTEHRRSLPVNGHRSIKPDDHGHDRSTAVSIGQLAGGVSSARLTPMDGWHRRAGALWFPVGSWFRSEYYGHDGKRSRWTASVDEAWAVRRGFGSDRYQYVARSWSDGPDAAGFLNTFTPVHSARQKAWTLALCGGLDGDGLCD